MGAYQRTTYRPTAEQLARDERHTRYMRRNVYLPIFAAILIVVLLFLLVLFLAFGVGTPAAYSFIAGMAGLIVILTAIPLILLMAILPLAYLGFLINRRQQRKMYPEAGPMAYRSRVQILLWQLDSLLERVRAQTERGGYMLERPLVRAHASAEYMKGLTRGLRRNFTRSDPDEFR